MRDRGRPQPTPFADPRRQEILVCLVLAAVTATAYAGVLTSNFVNLDDNLYVTANSSVQAGLTPQSIQYAWTTFFSGNYHPLTWLSLEADVSLFGLHPTGFHLTNLLLHLANSVLLLMLLRRMTGWLWPSAAVAFLFALHPLHVESVAWISERKDVLSTFFLILTLWAHMRYAAQPVASRYFVVGAMMLLGLLSKSMLVSLPLLLLLIDVWPLKRIELAWFPARSLSGGPVESPPLPTYPPCRLSALVYEKLPWFLLSALWCLVTLASQDSAGALASHQKMSAYIRIGNACYAYAWYLGKTFWPTGLTAFYPHPVTTLSPLMVGIGIGTLTAVSGLVVVLRRAPLAVGWLWFLVSLVPVIGLVQVGSQAYADRYTYVPHIGLFIMLIFGLYESIDWRGIGRGVGALVFATVVLGCFILTQRQVTYWRDSDALWHHALAVSPDNYMAHFMLGSQRLHQGRFDEAIPCFTEVVRLRPNTTDAHCNLGVAWQGLRRAREAEQEYAKALDINPKHRQALGNLAALLKFRGDLTGARDLFLRLVELEPNNPAVRRQLGLVLGGLGDFPEAVTQLSIAVRLDPQSSEAAYQLGMAFVHLGRDAEAKSLIEHALQLAPDFPGAHFNLAELLEREKDLAGAKEHFEAVLRLNPDDEAAKLRLQKLERRE